MYEINQSGETIEIFHTLGYVYGGNHVYVKFLEFMSDIMGKEDFQINYFEEYMKLRDVFDKKNVHIWKT